MSYIFNKVKHNTRKCGALLVTLSLFHFLTFSLSSCKDDDRVFDKSAAERIEEAVATDKEILESATNGWQMTLWTGEDYSGGGYTMFLTFKDGKVKVQSDIAPDTLSCQSSYDIIKNQGPVLTFNTYNDIMHYMATPSSSALSGEEGDYEFIIQRATQDSIYLKGKKWGNKTVMTRVAAGTDIPAMIKKMQSNVQSIAGYFANGSDSIIVDPSTRRFYPDATNTSISVPYAPTATGFVTASTNSVAAQQVEWNSSARQLTVNGKAYSNALPAGYGSINNWLGSWNIRYVNTQTYSYDYFTLNLEPTEDLIGQQALGALKGTFEVSGYTFELIVYYSPLTGLISIPAQYIADPTGTYDLFLLLGCDCTQDSLSWYAVTWSVVYDAATGTYQLVGDSSNTNGLEMNTLQILAVTSSGELIGNSSGQALSLVSLVYPDYVTKVQ